MEPTPRWRILLDELSALIARIPFTMQIWRIQSYLDVLKPYFVIDIGVLLCVGKAISNKRRFTLAWFRIDLGSILSNTVPRINLCLLGFGIHIMTFPGHDRHVTLPICFELPYIGLVWRGMKAEENTQDVARSNTPG